MFVDSFKNKILDVYPCEMKIKKCENECLNVICFNLFAI